MRRINFLLFFLSVLIAVMGSSLLVSCGGGGSGTVQTVMVSAVAATSSVAVGQTDQFTATVTGTSNTAVTWAVMGGASNGTISATGLYMAPATVPNPAMVTVTATSQADMSKAGSATVTVTAGTGGVTVSVTPGAVNLETYGKQTFVANVTGTTNTAVKWEVNGVAGGNATTGVINSSGMYTAPNFITGSLVPANSANAMVTITAVSQANASASGTAMISLTTQGQSAQNGAIELGTSGGNTNDFSKSGNTITCCGGTLGSLVNRNGSLFILSNNHVLARSDLAMTGEAIIQPGLIDTGTCTSTGAMTVANLSQFFTLEGNPANPVDVAIAQIVAGKVDTTGNILLLGTSVDQTTGVPVPGAPMAGSGIMANIGDSVAKSGRSSGLTCSTVDSVSAAFSVQYQKGCGTGTMFTVNYANQISVSGGDFSTEGDSGSLIVRQDTANPEALLFAGSNTDTVGNPIGDALLAMADSSNHVPTIVGGGAHAVFGCSLPPANAKSTLPTVAVPQESMATAAAARDTNAAKLLGLAGVRGVGVGASLDHQGEAAVLLFVAPGAPHSGLPAQVGGIRTRVVESSSDVAQGILSEEESRPLALQEATFAVTSLTAAEMARAKTVHTAHVDEWMKKAGVQGFGITSSADSPGEAGLMIFLIRGAQHDPIPPVIDGVRTRVRESSRFHAGFINAQPQPQAGCKVPVAKPAPQAKTDAKATPKS